MSQEAKPAGSDPEVVGRQAGDNVSSLRSGRFKHRWHHAVLAYRRHTPSPSVSFASGRAYQVVGLNQIALKVIQIDAIRRNKITPTFVGHGRHAPRGMKPLVSVGRSSGRALVNFFSARYHQLSTRPSPKTGHGGQPTRCSSPSTTCSATAATSSTSGRRTRPAEARLVVKRSIARLTTLGHKVSIDASVGFTRIEISGEGRGAAS
jgi:hypothetical protein